MAIPSGFRQRVTAFLEDGVDAANFRELNGVNHIQTASDLPDPVDGFHPLENEIYLFAGITQSDAGLEMPDSAPLLGHQRKHCGFIRTDGGTAIKGRGADIAISNLALSAPGGTVFDVDGDAESEFVLSGVNISDDEELGNIADLGTIGTFQSPELVETEIRDFDAGLTFNGTVHRTYIRAKVRDVTAANVTVFDFTDSFTGEVIDVSESDFEHVQSDTKIVNVAQNATISEVFLYQNNAHDPTVAKGNILTGQADPSESPFWVSSSFPVRNSAVVGEVSLSEETQTTFSSVDEWVGVSGPTSEGNETQRTSGDGEGGVEYIGRKDTNVQINIAVSWYGGNGDAYEFAIGKNGTPEPTSALPAEGGGQNSNNISTVTGIEDLTPGDTISLMVKNTSSTDAITISRYIINFIGQ